MFHFGKHIFFLLTMCCLFTISYADEIVEAVPLASSSDTRACTPEEKRQREETLKICDSSWSDWGVHPKPDAKELIDPNLCPTTLKSAKNLMGGCAEAAFEVPKIIGQLLLMGLVAGSKNKESYAYLLQYGSLEDMEAYFTNQFVRKYCKLAHHEEDNLYVTNMCDRQKKGESCQKYIDEIRRARDCRRSSEMRKRFNEEKSQIEQRANSLFSEQQKRKGIEKKYALDLKRIRGQCGKILNVYSQSYATILVNPLGYFANEAANAVKINKDTLNSYNECVKKETANYPELRDELLNYNSGIIDSVSTGIHSLSCYREDIQAELSCKVALSMAGVAGATKTVVAKLGKSAVSSVFKKSIKSEDILAKQLDKVLETSYAMAKPQTKGQPFMFWSKAADKKSTQFIVYPNEHAGQWARNNGLINKFSKDQIGKVKMPPGDYNYVIQQDGTLVLGRVDDEIEYGVRHLNLADNKAIIGGGQVRISSNGSYEFNSASGTFSPNLAGQYGNLYRYEENLQLGLESYFGSPGKKRSFTTRLRPEREPDAAKLIQICTEVIAFRSRNKSSCCSLSRSLCN